MPKKVARHHVYVIELDPAVLEHAKFRAANPGRDPRKPPLYVGMTGLDPETRFERHKYGVKDNHYVRRYGLRLRPDLYAELNPLPYAEAQRMEWGVGARAAQRRVCGVAEVAPREEGDGEAERRSPDVSFEER